LTQLNNALSSYGISATTDTNGYVAFGGTRAFSVTTGGAANTLATAAAGSANTGVYNFTTAAMTSQTVAQTLTFQNANGTATVTLADAATRAQSIASINTQTASLGIYAVQDASGNLVTLQSNSQFSVAASTTATSGVMGGAMSINITAPSTTASATGNATAALSLLTSAVSNLGTVQGKVGTGENLLGYAINLAQSQITNFSSAQSRIRDADIASEAANLTKASVLEQASMAAMAQANSAPQQVLALLRG
jgi:flagellin